MIFPLDMFERQYTYEICPPACHGHIKRTRWQIPIYGMQACNLNPNKIVDDGSYHTNHQID